MTVSGTTVERHQGAPEGYQAEFARERDPRYYPALFFGYLIIAAVFAVWRTVAVNWTVWFGPVTWLADMFGIVTSVLFFNIVRHRYRPVPRVVTGATRTVDVLIPTANEPPEVLEPAVIGACQVRGVRDVLVLDDGDRPEVRAMAQRHGARYVRRDGRAGAKAGNLNNGLRFTDAELVVTLDADHIPMPDFIERTAGYFDDPRVGFVQTPQTFYNTESMTFRKRSGSPQVWHEQEMFYDGVQPAKNASNSAFFTGTGAILRRSALDSVRGFATGTSTEDIHTSIRLHSQGWRSVFLPVPLAYGLEVDNLREFYRTRRRWAAGSLGLLLRHPDSPLRIRGLTVRQRLSYLSSLLAHLQGGHRAVMLFAPMVAVLTGQSPVRGTYAVFGFAFAAFTVLSLWITSRFGRGHFHLLYSEVFTVAATLPMVAGLRDLVGNAAAFEVSQKRAGRGGSGRLKAVYWVVAIVCSLVLARAVTLVVEGQQVALASWAALFLTVNLVALLTFLVSVERYERREEAPRYVELSPGELYQRLRCGAAVA